MNTRANYSPQAERDVHGLYNLFLLTSERTAERFLQATEKTLSRLVSIPGLGEKAPLASLAAAGVRYTAIDRFPNYIAFYRPTETGVLVLRVIHAARDLETAFSDPDAD